MSNNEIREKENITWGVSNDNSKLFKVVLKSLGFTILTVVLSVIFVLGLVVMIIPSNMENSTDIILLSIVIGGIFAMFMCTLTILDRLKK